MYEGERSPLNCFGELILANRIFIRGVNWIGDAVMTLPALRCIRNAFKEEEIYLMVKKWVSEVFLHNPHINHIIEYRDEYKGVKGKILASRTLKKYSFSKAIVLQNAFDAAALVYLSGIPERIGYNRDARGFLLTKAIEINEKTKRLHHTLYYLNLLKEDGIDTVYCHPWIYLTLQERMDAQRKLEVLRRPIVVLNPGATYGSAKRWPTEYFSRLAEMVINRLEGSIVITGSQAEQIVTEEILKGLKERDSIMNLTGRTSLRQLIGILSQADVVITNDSGPMHLAYAVGTPLVAIFGSTDPELTGPPSFVDPLAVGLNSRIEFDIPARVLFKKVECSPCFERDCRKGEPLCLKKISPEEVFETITNLLPQKKAVFFDRDGTLCHDAHYLNNKKDLHIYPEVQHLYRLKEKGFLLIGVSNQSGIARGLVDRSVNEEINKIFIDDYGFEAFYYCPHHPEENCACRKPSPGMLLKARAEYGIDLKSSVVVGDKDTDMQMAKAVGARAIFIRTEKNRDSRHADAVIENLSELHEII
jgi:heptosyltransferase-2